MSKKTESPIHKLARFIVDKHKALYVLFGICILFCSTTIGKVQLNEDITTFLPQETETRQGLDIMDEAFTTFGSAQVLLSNITYDSALALSEQIEEIEGVSGVEFDDTEEHYKQSSALLAISFGDESDAPQVEAAWEEIQLLLTDYDSYFNTEIGYSESDELAEDMKLILLLAVLVIVVVLLFTSRSYMEVPVLLITFGVAAILNMGTNYLFGEISSITNSIAIILQLALAIDYAVILVHRFSEERELGPSPQDAATEALSKALVEISSSSMTTIAGLLALTFMQYRMGLDMGRVLIKGVLCSLITVFLLMPGLLILFSGVIDRTKHRSFVPQIRGWGRLLVKLRYLLPALFAVLLLFGINLSGKTEYVFSINAIDISHPSEKRISYDKIADTFGADNTIALLIPSGDYASEGAILRQVEAMPDIRSATGLANIEIDSDDFNGDYVLSDSLTARQLSEALSIDIELMRMLYLAYGVDQENYTAIFGETDSYAVPLIDMFLFICEQKDSGVIQLDDEEQEQDIDDIHEALLDAKAQLTSEDWTRLIFVTSLPEESEDSYALLEEIRGIAATYYGDEVLLVGDTTSARDLRDAFATDNKLIGILTVVFVLLVLLFTFQSAGLPFLLILTIQGSIWLNFSFPYLTGTNVFFISYLIVSSIQMGATIDYAIVITGRYQELKQELPLHEAMVEALNQAFPTILTSGSILSIAGILIYRLTGNPTVSGIGLAIGRGSLISIVLVLSVLPTILLLGDRLIEKTAFALSSDRNQRFNRGTMRLDGHIRGHVSGYVDAEIKGVLHGSVDALIESKYQELEVQEDDDAQ